MEHYSDGSSNLHSALVSAGGTIRRFPGKYRDTRVDGELHGWFRRVVREQFDDDPDACVIEPNIAVLADLEVPTGDLIEKASIQVIVTQGESIEDYCMKEDGANQAQYLRLDFDLGCLGPMFKESLPHIHVKPDHEPRFALHTGHVVAEFIDMIYRNYKHDLWMVWASRVWHDELRRRGRNANTSVFMPVSEAFKASQIGYLISQSSELKQMKASWRAAREEMFPLQIDSALSCVNL
jgi:hypothetical protein